MMMARRGVIATAHLDPKDVSGLQNWLRADDCAAVGDGNPVTNWVDRIGGYVFTEATNKPLYQANGVGGQPALDFNGSSHQLARSGNLFSNTDGSVFLVINADTVSSIQTLYANRLGGGTRLVYFGNIGTGGVQVRQRNADTADSIRGPNTLSAATDSVWNFRSTGTAYAMQVNGVGQTKTVLAGADTGDWYGDTSSRDLVVVGSNGVGEFFNGRIAEILDYDHDLTVAELLVVKSYLRGRYGITIA